MDWLRRGSLALLLVAGAAWPTWGHETDQYTLPRGREFAEVGDYFTRWAYDAIEHAVEMTNQRIEQAINAHESQDALRHLQSPDYIATAVNREFPWAMDVIEGFERWVNLPETKRRYPGRVVGYKEQFTNIYQRVHFPLDPRQFFRLFLGSTMKVYGVYLGTDKIGHFTDMGMNYYREYRKALRAGKSEDQAIRLAIHVGTHGLIFSERGMLGYLSAGAYSNADLAANYLGFLFYKNLTDPVSLKGRLRPPMLEQDGSYWKIADHVRRDSDFFSLFFSDHLNEVLNPSLFETAMRPAVRQAIEKRTEAILERYCDEKNIPRSPDYFIQQARELSTYYGVDYGHQGTLQELVTVASACFPNDQPVSNTPPPQPLYLGAVDHPDKIPATDAQGRTPLHLLAENLDAPSVSLLLDKGADPNPQDHQGRTPLHYATVAGHIRAAVELLDRGADVHLPDQFNITALHLAAARNESALVRLLISHKADVSARDDFGRTPLHEAARAGNHDAIHLLLQTGADPRAKDAYGTTPLHLACRYSHLLAAKALLDRGADVNAQSDSHATPLHEAALADDKAIVKLLLSHGAKPNLRNRKGLTARDIAQTRASRNHQAIATMLLSGNPPPWTP